MMPASGHIMDILMPYLAVPIAFCVLLAGMMQMILLQLQLARLGQRTALLLSACQNRVWLCLGCISAALGAGGMQLNLLVDLVLASFLDTGALSWLYYADGLFYQLPLGIIGIAIQRRIIAATIFNICRF